MLNREHVKELLLSGKTLQEVATALGVTKQRIGQLRKELNLKRGQFGKALLVKEKKKSSLQVQKEIWFSLGKSTAHREDLDKQCYSLFVRKRQNAKKSKWEWELKYSDVTFPSHCPILGIELNYYADKRAENSPSFDRIDCTKGYVAGNVVVVSWRANRIKNDGNAEEHERIASWMKEHT